MQINGCEMILDLLLLRNLMQFLFTSNKLLTLLRIHIFQLLLLLNDNMWPRMLSERCTSIIHNRGSQTFQARSPFLVNPRPEPPSPHKNNFNSHANFNVMGGLKKVRQKFTTHNILEKLLYPYSLLTNIILKKNKFSLILLFRIWALQKFYTQLVIPIWTGGETKIISDECLKSTPAGNTQWRVLSLKSFTCFTVNV
ncbi:hypothetical protein AGLY_009559 [Aphis glycines]|uniref:Uncharacterized protein n=1 Tax=Aphis glycines TaxID=307491 RepID=A0A6G0TIE3_APHGL|nr:hypothetical protein AGLY_009559 [Aphis glycines]